MAILLKEQMRKQVQRNTMLSILWPSRHMLAMDLGDRSASPPRYADDFLPGVEEGRGDWRR